MHTRLTWLDTQKAKAVNDRIIEFIALDDQPFSVVEDKGFRKLIAHLEPRYNIRCRRFFSDLSLPALYSVVTSHIHNMIDKNGLNISFTKDIWTSDASQVSMLSFTAQWLDEDFHMQKALLHAQVWYQAFENMLEK